MRSWGKVLTAEKWAECEDVVQMVDHLYGKVSDRKLRLLGCACCRRVWGIYEQPARDAVEVAERLADGKATKVECQKAESSLKRTANVTGPREVVASSAYRAAAHASRNAANDFASVLVPHPRYPWEASEYEQYRGECDSILAREIRANVSLVRDIFGNPFRPVKLNSDWRTSTAVALAAQMYESRDFGAMPILADALQDAGCDKEDILSHCRGPGPHVRGCWVVDLILGKV
jgi:hypothetical protein